MVKTAGTAKLFLSHHSRLLRRNAFQSGLTRAPSYHAGAVAHARAASPTVAHAHAYAVSKSAAIQPAASYHSGGVSNAGSNGGASTSTHSHSHAHGKLGGNGLAGNGAHYSHPLAALVNAGLNSSFIGGLPAAKASSSTASAVIAAQPFSIPNFPCEVSAIRRIFAEQSCVGKDRSFVISDVGVVERQYARWCRELPSVEAFYAVKCNPDETLLKTLAANGTGFDVASAAEMEMALSMGIEPHNIIFANPIKSVRDLQYAHKSGVHKMTFDNLDEVIKIKEHCPNAQLVLRLLADDSSSVMRFGVKFGAALAQVPALLTLASRLELDVIGTSFHIGSGCFDANAYEKAIALSRHVFDLAHNMGLPRFTFLDLGGGFPGNPRPNEDTGKVPSFEKFAAVIRQSLAIHFPSETHAHVRVIAEPGRYLATAYSTLFAHVQGKREELLPVTATAAAAHTNAAAPRKFLYYINDGVYGSFNCILFDHAHPMPIPAYRFMKDRASLDRRDKNNTAGLPVPTPLALASSLFANSASASVSYTSTVPLATEFSSLSISARAMHSSSVAARDDNCVATFFGPTCDSLDVICKDTQMEELFVGDWLAFPEMGAYTNAAATTFNGMPKPQVHYARSKNAAPVSRK